jgi:transcriptional regulator with XRE-family HTH domain
MSVMVVAPNRVNYVNVLYPKCRLRELRAKHELTLKQVAEKCKYKHKDGRVRSMSVSALCCAEQGGNIYMSAADALAKFYGVSKCEIWQEV